ncbi:MAG: fccA2 [Firmicutes bacterium]|nr:fccA2 [Bacillota bacterium]
MVKYVETEVAVIGSGAAGMAAACAAAERGAKATIFEKNSRIGGSIRGGMGPLGIESHLQKEKHLHFTAEEAFKFHMDFTHWKVDARLVGEYIRKSADTISWLEGMGVKFTDVAAYYPGAYFTWHTVDYEAEKITDVLFVQAKKFGAEIYYETTVKKILNDNGRILGLSGRDNYGKDIMVQAKAVVVATGGGSGNAAWIKEQTGYNQGQDLFIISYPEIQGEGVRMAWEAGAAASPVTVDAFICLPDPYGGPGGTLEELGAFRQPNLMVNLDGERFMNEEIIKNPGLGGNAVHRQKNGCGIMIFDAPIKDDYAEYGLDYGLVNRPFRKGAPIDGIIEKARCEGYEHLFMADSIEELSAAAGIDARNLARTIAEYNAACDSGRDEIFYKPPKYLRPITKPKFYAARFFLSGYGVLGGIKINHHAEVLSKEHEVILGLYAAGNDANDVFGDTYPFALAGSSSGFCYNIGRIARENAAKYVQS